MRIHIKQVDAFTETPLTGNPAGVVANAEGLSDQHMQTVAREMSVPETAFILPPSTPAANLRIRWFTPSTEVPLCGHATVAGFHALAEEGLYGMKNPGTYSFKVETKSGILPVSVEKKGDGIDVLFGLTVPEFTRAGQFKLDVMRILNISLEEFENRMPIVVANYLYVPIRRLHEAELLRHVAVSFQQKPGRSLRIYDGNSGTDVVRPFALLRADSGDQRRSRHRFSQRTPGTLFVRAGRTPAGRRQDQPGG
jgi:PhzF family phenazine biosynthesis protein